MCLVYVSWCYCCCCCCCYYFRFLLKGWVGIVDQCRFLNKPHECCSNAKYKSIWAPDMPSPSIPSVKDLRKLPKHLTENNNPQLIPSPLHHTKKKHDIIAPPPFPPYTLEPNPP